MPRRLAAASFALALWAAPALGSATVDVYVFDFDYSLNLPPGPIADPVIYAGDTIRWVWLEDFHNVVACAGQAEFWESDVFAAGDTFVYQFTIPGVYQYYCSPHGQDLGNGTYDGMGGSITVLPIPAPGPALCIALSATLACRRRRP
jgi:hypothetical protein